MYMYTYMYISIRITIYISSYIGEGTAMNINVYDEYRYKSRYKLHIVYVHTSLDVVSQVSIDIYLCTFTHI